MYRQIRRVVAAGGAALSALGIAVASVACGGTTTAPQAPQPSGPPGAQLWIQHYKLPPRSGPGYVQVVAVSPRGDKVYMTGEGATVAYSAATGARLWASHGGASVAVSPGGATVFVTGGTSNPGQRGPQGSGYATAAYNAATGAQLWASRYNALGKPGGYGPAGPKSVVVSPGGNKVFVTGTSVAAGSGPDYATVAYNATTGAQLWASRYNGPGNGPEIMFPGGPQNMAVSRDGATVYVTGGSKGTGSVFDAATVAYNAATGKQLWVSRSHGPTGGGGSAVAVSPSGSTVFVTGGSEGAGPGPDYGTVAYNAATGRQLWVSRYNGPGNRDDASGSVAVSPDGATVFVTGTSTGTAATGEDYATIAYNAATGARLWLQRYNGPQNRDDNAWAMAVSPNGAKVYVAGHRADDRSGATVAYNPSTGAQLWVTRPAYNPTAVAVSPDGATVFVAGYSHGGPGGGYVTVAYRS